MFTGIIESLGKIVSLRREASNLHIGMQASFVHELKVDQSIAHNGVCLTVTEIIDNIYYVTAIEETLQKTTLGKWQENNFVNLERCLEIGSRLDGHWVQGHVDQTATCINIEDKNGSWLFSFEYDQAKGNITIEKGSISVNGISLTVVNSGINTFSVAIIPYTFEHTNLQYLKKGDEVNLEFDILGKYISKLMTSRLV
jgi:riboflavin synthase